MAVELDWDTIRDALAGLTPALKLVVHADETQSPLSVELAELAQAIVETAGGGATIEQGDGAAVPATPALSLALGERAPIHYLALPEQREAAPFAEALVHLARLASSSPDASEPAEPWAERLSELSEPADLLVFAAPSCPHCPQAVSIANRIALASPRVTTTIVDVQRYENLAKRFNVQSVPRTILDGGLSLTGVVQADELVSHILARGTPELSERVLVSLIETGRIADATAELGTEHGPQSLVAAWRRSTTSSRMGLLLAVEEVLEDDRAALDGIVADLLGLLAADDAALQGDTADLLGRIGHPDATDAIQALLGHDNPDVAEIAEEALEQIQERAES